MPKNHTPLTQLEHFLDRHHVATLWSAVVIAFLLIVSRRPDIVTHAQFWAEDGKIWYADVYNHGFRALFYIYAGCLVLFYNLVALVALLLPLKYVPLFFGLVAICLQVFPIILINSDRLSHIIRYRSLAIVISLLYVSIPNATEVFGNVANTQWHLGVASFLVLISRPSKSRLWLVFDIFVLLATGLSGPLAIMLLPVAALLWRSHSTKQHRRNFSLLALLAMLQLLCIFLLSYSSRVGAQSDANALLAVKMLVGQIFMGALLGQKRVNLFYNHPLILVLLLVIGLSLVTYAVLQGPLWLKLMNLYALILYAAMLVSLKPVKGFNIWLGLTNPGGGQRYWYIPMLAWIMTLVWLFLAAKQIVPKVVSGVLLAILLFVGIPTNWAIPPLPNLHFQTYARQFQAVPAGTNYTIPINPSWTMVLHKK